MDDCNEIEWSALKRRVFKGVGLSGNYYIVADMREHRYRSELYFEGGRLPLAVGRISFLMRLAEIHDVTHTR